GAGGGGMAMVQGEGSPRAGGILHATVRALVFEGPKLMARLFIETMDPFCRVRPRHQVHDVHPPLGHRRTAVARTDIHVPLRLEGIRPEALDDSRFAPNAVAVGAAPLRPIFALGYTNATGDECGEKNCSGYVRHAYSLRNMVLVSIQPSRKKQWTGVNS